MSNTYSGGIAMVSVDDAVEIAELCTLAGCPGRIAEFFGSRLTPGLVKDQLAEAAATPTPAANTTRGAGEQRLDFRWPDLAERDRLAVTLQRRFEQVYRKRLLDVVAIDRDQLPPPSAAVMGGDRGKAVFDRQHERADRDVISRAMQADGQDLGQQHRADVRGLGGMLTHHRFEDAPGGDLQFIGRHVWRVGFGRPARHRGWHSGTGHPPHNQLLHVSGRALG